MSALAKEGLIWAWALALALVVLCLPIYNPDLFWHLSAARWMVGHGAIPFSDPLSFTKFGASWVNFEWLAQLALYGVHRACGMTGLWALKALLLIGVYWPLDAIMRVRRASRPARAAGLALWLCAALTQADLRVDLISAAFFGILLLRLQTGRASFLFGFLFFALWANLHAGFIVGLALYAGWMIGVWAWRGDRPESLNAEACGALLGCLLNPYGAQIFSVVAAHAADPIGRLVGEWGPLDLAKTSHVPRLAALAAGLALAWRARWTHATLAAATAALAAATAVSARFGIYFAALTPAILAAALPKPRIAPVVAALFAATMLLYSPMAHVQWGRSFSDVFVARRAINYVASHQEVFGPLRLFNTYEWGGYLCWRLGPESRVYGDGRYLFHGQLLELEKALSGPEPMSQFIERNRLEALLIRNYPTMIDGTRVYPDGSRKELSRPWYIAYLPRERWALVWWDAQALIFVERNKVPAAWLVENEYRWWRPRDSEALADALARGEADAKLVQREKARQILTR